MPFGRKAGVTEAIMKTASQPRIHMDGVAVTRAIVQASKLLDVDVLDHLVIGQGKWVSLKERGLGFA